jgi:predicted RNase H-like HicB family nuclease
MVLNWRGIMKRIHFNIPVLVEKDGDEYHAFSPAFRGLHTCGATQREALDNAVNAIRAYVASLIKHGEPIPCCVVTQEEYPKQKYRQVNRDIQLSLAACV